MKQNKRLPRKLKKKYLKIGVKLMLKNRDIFRQLSEDELIFGESRCRVNKSGIERIKPLI